MCEVRPVSVYTDSSVNRSRSFVVKLPVRLSGVEEEGKPPLLHRTSAGGEECLRDGEGCGLSYIGVRRAPENTGRVCVCLQS